MALRRLAPVSVQYVELKRRAILSWHLYYSIYNRGLMPDRFFLNLIYPDMKIDNKPDLIISSGGETLLYNILISRHYDCENIFSGSVRNLDTAFFSAILTPYRRFSGRNPYICGLKPSPVDPDLQPSTGQQIDYCFLIGGPSGTHAYRESDWQKIFALTRQAARHSKLAIFTSHRTPPEIEAGFKTLKSERVEVFDSKEVRSSDVFDYCKRSRGIVVTEDSNSMITEAICCRSPY